ncbi:MAG: hypothetical protein J6M38_05015, partial [Lentisphaeria bacterium]|nr:hypothetical protein [Lentisphaeria bacterium]
MIIPKVKKETPGSRIVFIHPEITLDVCDEYAEKACTALAAFLPQCTVRRKSGGARITVIKDPSFAGSDEAYRLEIRESGISIACAAYPGLRNALAVFSTLVSFTDGQFRLCETCIEDAPEARHRGVMLDLAGGI